MPPGARDTATRAANRMERRRLEPQLQAAVRRLHEDAKRSPAAAIRTGRWPLITKPDKIAYAVAAGGPSGGAVGGLIAHGAQNLEVRA